MSKLCVEGVQAQVQDVATDIQYFVNIKKASQEMSDVRLVTLLGYHVMVV